MPSKYELMLLGHCCRLMVDGLVFRGALLTDWPSAQELPLHKRSCDAGKASGASGAARLTSPQAEAATELLLEASAALSSTRDREEALLIVLDDN